ncbi:MAG: DUF488 domain-containing protein [Bacteroidales bacterium]|jgi:uncharacterized protein YeaO (DUF488 family)|nr:DUF488 domain-containing protein [Bacteroidales bacterium]MCK9449629.1 DUF488 domain-containing protein [Bacteroidales bacterium]MDD3702269.1 DUF488 domain-containing protein [Bacteroidales bacterium]MDY0368856.1 DUF488 domain-containing protein [Bacteroidales bacterium]
MKIKRIYEKPSSEDGYRVLIDRLWPRGIRKEEAALNEWKKELAPSNELRKWFGHQPERFEEFKKQYVEELNKQSAALDQLRQLSTDQEVTLLYAAKDELHNNAVVLLELLTKAK